MNMDFVLALADGDMAVSVAFIGMMILALLVVVPLKLLIAAG